MSSSRNLARHLEPPLSNERLDRQWEGVLRRSNRRPRAPLAALGIGLAAACAVVLVLVFRSFDASPELLEGASVETSGTNSQVITLAEGSRVELTPATLLEFPIVQRQAVRVSLKRGEARFDVAHVPDRTFTVVTRPVEIEVRGTRFRVQVSEGPRGRVTVSVEQGRVEVRRSGSEEAGHQLAAGETWSVAVEGAAPVPAAPVVTHRAEPSAVPAPSATAPATGSAARPGPSASADAPDQFSELVKARKYREAYASLGPSGFSRELGQANARRLLELADAARLSGRPAEAARAFDRLRRAHRSDPRAGLAALELGRLRMDSLGDVSGALEAFTDAAALARSEAVREDAEARKVQALERLGDVAGCARARDAYLARFPSGIHAANIRRRCATR
jgi:transmembrane sensor